MRKIVVYATLGIALGAATARAANLVVDADGKATPRNCNADAVTPYTTIQGAIDAAGSGDTIVVCPGAPYAEQPVVAKPLTISGRGDATVRPSPMLDNTTGLTSGLPLAAGILVMDTTGVVIEGITVDGADNGATDCSNDPVGVFFRNASGTLQDAVVRNMRLGAGLEGCPAGIGVFVESSEGATAAVVLQRNSVHDYHSVGISALGEGTTLTALRNRVTGLGPTPFAQDGIVLAAGAGGSLQNNVITNHFWTDWDPLGFPAANVLILSAADGVVLKGNTLANAQLGIVFAADGGLIQGNDVTQTGRDPFLGAPLFGALVVSGASNLIQANTLTNAGDAGIQIFGTGNTVRRNRINEAQIGIWSVGPNTIPITGFQMNDFFNVAVGVHTGSAPPLAPRLRAAARRGGMAAPSPVR